MFLWFVSVGLAAPSLVPSFTNDEAFAESFTAIADLNDGTYILAQLLFTNAGFGDQKARCRALVSPSGESVMPAASATAIRN